MITALHQILLLTYLLLKHSRLLAR